MRRDRDASWAWKCCQRAFLDVHGTLWGKTLIVLLSIAFAFFTVASLAGVLKAIVENGARIAA